jgi:beta-lactamase regulating signal transducer with metallopeptidase domain
MSEMLNSIAASWWSWIAAVTAQVAILGALVWAIDLPLKRRGWPQVRYALWALVFVKLLLPPTLALPTSIAAHILAPASTAVVSTAGPSAAITDVAAANGASAVRLPEPGYAPDRAGQATAASAIDPTSSTRFTYPSLPACAMLFWAAMVVAIGAWLMRKVYNLRRVAACGVAAEWAEEALKSAAARMAIAHLPRVVATTQMKSAAVFGFLRPTVFVPESWRDEYSPRELSHILMHELAHIKRLDLAANTLQTILHVLFWFHPFVWLAGRRTRELRELCCDATVARILRRETVEYRQTLVEAGRRILAMKSPLSLGLLGLFENPARFRVRLEHLTRPLWKYSRTRTATAFAVVVAMTLFVIPMARLSAAAPGTRAGTEKAPTKQPAVQSTDKASQAGKPKVIAGAVRDSGGKNVAGVQIACYPLVLTGDKGTSLQAASGDKGRFKIELPSNVDTKAWLLVAKYPGQLGFETAVPDADRQLISVPITIVPAEGSIRGTVKDTAGRPVSAKVSLVSLSNTSVAAASSAVLTRIYDIRSLLSEPGSSKRDARTKGEDLAVLLMAGVDQTIWHKAPEQYVIEYRDLEGGRLLVYAPEDTQKKVQARIDQLRKDKQIKDEIRSTVLDERAVRQMEWRLDPFPGAVEFFTVTTDSSGGFMIHDLPRDYAATIKVFGEGIGTRTQEVKVDDGRHEVTVKGAAAIRGRVESTDTNADLASLSVSLISIPPAAGTARRTVTSTSGAFSFDSLEPGKYQLDVYPKPDRKMVEISSCTIEVAPGETGNALIRVESGGSVHGRVVDKSTGGPLNADRVSLMASGPNYTTGFSIDEGGAFRVCLPAGSWTLMATYMDEDGQTVFDRESEKDVEVRPGEDIDAGDIEANVPSKEDQENAESQSGKISGRIMCDDPSANLQGITVIAVQNAATGFFRSAVSAKDGTFAIDKLRPGRYQINTSFPEGTPLVQSEPPTVSIDAREVVTVEIRVVSGAIIKGRVINSATGQPIQPGDGVTLLLTRSMETGGEVSLGGHLDGTGSYKYSVAPGTYVAKAFVLGKDKQATFLEISNYVVTVQSGQIVTAPDIAVTLPAQK